MRIVPAPGIGMAAGQPLPFALRDSSGRLLIARGTVLATEAQIAALAARGMWVSSDDADNFQRAYAAQLDGMVRSDKALGAIASAKPDLEAFSAGAAGQPTRPEDWTTIIRRVHALLREPPATGFVAQLESLRADLLGLLQRSPDRALLALVSMAGRELDHYAASHAVLVAALCELVAAQVLAMPVARRQSLTLAAMSMNIAMASLQNVLAMQERPPDEAQRAQIAGHSRESAEQLRQLGVTDELWLEAVAHHHDAVAGPLACRPVGLQLARIILRADLFAARLSPRKNRRALSAAAAAQVAYLDENKQPDEAGMALIKAIGIYPPGCFVELASGEVGVVVRRGKQAAKPSVEAVVSRSGLPIGVPILRQTCNSSYGIVRSLAPHEVKLLLDLEGLLKR
jgi:HD-GYP domain-containing protein (c-di-GMP phosphodiesterase class II)